jgi:putative flavoprotein involved in K+ transport
MTTTTEAIVIGAGQAGLATSWCLGRHGVAHVVLERGRVGERWRSERWDSLRLLTPNWLTRLPGLVYAGPEPDGFLSMAEVVGFLDDYARIAAAPVETGTTVRRVRRIGDHYNVETDRGTWHAPVVVIATGHCDTPKVPAAAAGLPDWVHQITPTAYRNPDSLPDGGVLVVGASASGVQLADEIRSSGREITLAVGRHIRLPRRYRDRDIMWWLDRTGILTKPAARVAEIAAARQEPSLQLVGSPEGRDVDLEHLARSGIRLVGHLAGIDGSRVHFAGDLHETTSAAEGRLQRLLAKLDRTAIALQHTVPVERVPSIVLGAPETTLDLEAAGIRTVLWATGFRRDYAWLDVPVLDAAGEIVHDGGITPSPGLYVLGLNFMRRRNSSFIAGAGQDAAELADDILARLAARPRQAA